MDADKIDHLMAGAIDLHVHVAPDPYSERRVDAIELAQQALDAGMKAVVFKAHSYGTAPVAHMVNRFIGTDLLVGSIALNKHVGGLNPDAVEAAARVGSKIVWMPTVSATGHESPDKQPVSLITQDGTLAPQIAPILEIIKSHHMALATGHITAMEVFKITREATRQQINVIITHPLAGPSGGLITIEEAKELAAMGAYIEHCFLACMPSIHLSPAVMAENVKAIGAERCILSTDFGQVIHPTPAQGFRNMLSCMLKSGLTERELETLVKVNPAKLLGLGSSDVIS